MRNLEEKIVSWGRSQASIRAILVVGSRARQDHPGDEWADLDLMVFAADFTDYLACGDWLNEIGVVWVCIPSQTSNGDPERLVLFEDAKKVDFVFYPADELKRLARSKALPEVYQRGYSILIDKDGWAAQMPGPPNAPPPSKLPSKDDFLATVNEFWYGAVYVAKQIQRRNLWVVKARDGTMKDGLLEMMEWHAVATHGLDYDTWHSGHFLAEWTDPQTWAALHSAFGTFEARDSWRALRATMELFRRLATETAQCLDYSYPETLDRRVAQFVSGLDAERDL